METDMKQKKSHQLFLFTSWYKTILCLLFPLFMHQQANAQWLGEIIMDGTTWSPSYINYSDPKWDPSTQTYYNGYWKSYNPCNAEYVRDDTYGGMILFNLDMCPLGGSIRSTDNSYD